MIEALAKRITIIFIKNNIINSEDSEIYNYCFETTIVMGISYFVLFILSVAFREFVSSFIFLFSFLVFRKTCGGYHANNYTSCGIMSLFSYLFLIFIIKKNSVIFNISFILLIIGLIVILIFSPIQNENKPFTEKQYKRFKIISKALAAAIIFIFTVLELCGKNDLLLNKYFYSFCYGIDLVALALLMSITERRINHAKN